MPDKGDRSPADKQPLRLLFLKLNLRKKNTASGMKIIDFIPEAVFSVYNLLNLMPQSGTSLHSGRGFRP